MKGRDYWRNEMAKGIIRAQGGDTKALENLLDEIELLEKNQLTPVAADEKVVAWLNINTGGVSLNRGSGFDVPLFRR